MPFQLNLELLKEFEETLNPAKPDKSPIPAKILGYGEISTVFEIEEISTEKLACKRMPLFDNVQELNNYIELYNRYNELLRNAGITIPEYGAEKVITESGRVVLYLFQRKLPVNSICNNIIHVINDDEAGYLVSNILRELNKVWKFNKEFKPALELAIDGQISNFALLNFTSESGLLPKKMSLVYLDTSTPLIRENGIEQLNALLFLKPAPPILRCILKKFYLQSILDRYYRFRDVAVDLIANFYKEQRSELIPALILIANEFFSNEAVIPDITPITEKEVREYYKDDASTWKLYLRARKVHRFIKGKIFRRYYPYILPGEIQR